MSKRTYDVSVDCVVNDYPHKRTNLRPWTGSDPYSQTLNPGLGLCQFSTQEGLLQSTLELDCSRKTSGLSWQCDNLYARNDFLDSLNHESSLPEHLFSIPRFLEDQYSSNLIDVPETPVSSLTEELSQLASKAATPVSSPVAYLNTPELENSKVCFGVVSYISVRCLFQLWFWTLDKSYGTCAVRLLDAFEHIISTEVIKLKHSGHLFRLQ